MKVKTFFAVVLMSPALLEGCQLSTPQADTTLDNMGSTKVVSISANPNDDPGEVDYMVEMRNFSFTPNLIEAEPGETIKIKLASVQGYHNFIIDKLGVESQGLPEGGNQVIEVTIPDSANAGDEFVFYCSIGSHRQQGMEGVLRVR